MKLNKTIISKVSLVSFISLVSFVSFVSSCSKSDDIDGLQNAPGVTLGGVNGYSTYFEEEMSKTRGGENLTRAWEKPSGYVDYEGGYQPIAIAFTKNGEDPTVGPNPENPKSMMGFFFKVDDNWHTTVDITADTEYQLYGFIPNMPVIEYSITDRSGGNTNYSDGAIMTLRNVPSVMPNDFCVVIGAKHGTDKEHDSGLRRGDFTFNSSQGAEGKDFVFLLFDHLYASLSINMKVYDEYAELRKIYLKSLKLSNLVDEDVTTDKTNITIDLKANDGSKSPIESVTFTPTGDPVSGDGIEFWSNADGYPLTTAYQQFIGNFMPNGITKFVLTSEYDVYDRKGNLIRENCKATNTMELKELFTGQKETERGKRYTINMTILPTFLYQMSNWDLENPVILREN